MNTIAIGDKNIKNISALELVEIARIEGVHLFFEHWEDMVVSDFSNTMFSDTIALDFNQKSKEKPNLEKTIVFFFNFEKYSFHWHFKDDSNIRESKRLSFESIRYLISNDYDIPLY